MPLRSFSEFSPTKRATKKVKENLGKRGLRAVLRSHNDPGVERYRRASITASASLIQRALTIVISFVSVPLTVHYLGPERYGVWLTISSLLVWMAMTDFGLAGNALINVLSEADGKDDKQAAQEYASSAVWTLVIIATFFAITAAISFHYIPWNLVFRVSTVSPHELSLACALTLTFFILSLPLSVQNSIYSAYQDGFLSNICGIAMNLSSLLALIVVTRFHGGLPQLVMALSGIKTLLALVNVYYMFFIRYRWLLPIPSAVRWHCIHRLFKLGAKYLVVQLGALGMFQSQPMIITQVLGPAKVVAFVIAQKIITFPMDLVYMSTSPFVATFGEAKARGDWAWIRSAYRNLTLASIVAGIPIMLAIGVTAKPLIRIWAGPAAVPETTLIFWLSLYNVIGIVLMASGQLLAGVERVNALACSTFLCAISIIGLGIPFSRWMGVSGIGLAMAISKLVTFLPIQMWAVQQLFTREKSPYKKSVSRAAA